jgi:hypothetical protein
MALTEGCTACLESIDGKEVEDLKVTRIYSFKWVKVEKGDKSAEWIRSSLLTEKE